MQPQSQSQAQSQSQLRPPILHPLHLLDSYLVSILRDSNKSNINNNNDNNDNDNKPKPNNQNQGIESNKTKNILQICNFLFSNKPTPISSLSSPSVPSPSSSSLPSSSFVHSNISFSLLESALEVLETDDVIDSNNTPHHVPFTSSNTASGTINPQTTTTATPAVRLIRSSLYGRTMIVVRSSSSLSSSNNHHHHYSSSYNTGNKQKRQRRMGYNGHDSNNHHNSTPEYLITIGRTNHHFISATASTKQTVDDTTTTTATNDDDDNSKNSNDKDNNKQREEKEMNTCNMNKGTIDIFQDLLIGKIGYHCTCRSFYERTKHSSNHHNNQRKNYHHPPPPPAGMMNGDHFNCNIDKSDDDDNDDGSDYVHDDNHRFVICKHLLAARIAPFLQDYSTKKSTEAGARGRGIIGGLGGFGGNNYSNSNENTVPCYYREEVVDEEEFNQLYVNFSMGLWY